MPLPSRDTEKTRAPMLRLAVSRDGVGLELTAPARVGPLEVLELFASLPSVRFPADISGGVDRFRHRRGRLEHLRMGIHREALAQWARPRLTGLLSERTPEVTIYATSHGATVAVSDPTPVHANAEDHFVAFNVTMVCRGPDVWLIPTDVRATDVRTPPTVQAIRALATVLGSTAKRRGCAFLIEDAIRALSLDLVPRLGGRVPDTRDLTLEPIFAQDDRWQLFAARELTIRAGAEVATLELAELLEPGDRAAMDGDIDQARDRYLHALEYAPSQEEIVRRVAELDAAFGARTHGALQFLAELPRLQAGSRMLRAILLERAGSKNDAVAAFIHAGEDETTPSLAAFCYSRASLLVDDPFESLRLLDRAVSLAPSLSSLRWQRFEMVLRTARIEDARAEADHLEALTHGPNNRADVWRRVSERFVAFGYFTEATALLERALRYRPDDGPVLVALGKTLLRGNDPNRALPLLRRAIEVKHPTEDARAEAELVYATSLADVVHDVPSALARLRFVPAQSHFSCDAWLAEARWRILLSDDHGAAVAYAKLRDRLLMQAPNAKAGAAEWLAEAARFEHARRGDPFAARQHVLAALRIQPGDAALLELLRTVSPVAKEVQPLSPNPEGEAKVGQLAELPAQADEEFDEDVAAARVEDLTQKLRANPGDDVVGDELARLLEKLGRSHDLLALLMARMDDASPEKRKTLRPRTVDTLNRLGQAAKHDGRDMEATLFHDAASMFAE